MRGRRVIGLVARREIVETLRTRTFRVATAILIAGAIAGVVIPRYVGSGKATESFGLVGATPPGVASALVGQGPFLDAQVKTRAVPDEATARAALKAKAIDAALVDGTRVIVRRADSKLSLALNRAVAQDRLSQRLAAAGIPPAETANLVAPTPLPTTEIDPLSSSTKANRALALAGVLLIYLALLTYGGMVSQSIAEEKSTRVSEVLLGAVRPHQLLAGKIAGIGSVGVIQLLAVGIPAGVVALAQGSLHVPRGTPLTFAAVVMWFVLGYAMYSCAYAAVGATASRPQEAAAAVGPITLVVVASFGAALHALSNPNTGVTGVFSFLPPTAPMAMLPRAALGDVAPWEVAASVVLVLAFTYALVRLAGRIYSGAIVRTGRRVKLREAWRSAAATG